MFAFCFINGRLESSFAKFKANHAHHEISNDQIRYLDSLQDDSIFRKQLSKILIPRPVNSKNHRKVGQFLKETLEDLHFSVEIDQFTDITPKGNMTFRNIIGTLNPKAERFFVLAAHYDSKSYEYHEFLGATDSAVPCVMILELARIFKNFNLKKNSDVSLKIIFFDGEEAFVSWGPKDSIYGAKHLARKMQTSMTNSRLLSGNELVSDLERIDVLMLLDLLGQANPTIYNYFDVTKDLFISLSNVEKRLFRLGMLRRRTQNQYFNKAVRYAYIEDDHIPFLQRKVPILHIIPLPFPDAWHTTYDNYDILDFDTIHDLSLIIQVFTAQYLHLTPNEANSVSAGISLSNINFVYLLFILTLL